ncbi:MAG: AraC family ligand binding domain-containing protein [Steroidobacteraceae bacterium]
MGQRQAAEWSATQPTSVQGVECFGAHFVSHVFDRHSHETFSIGTTFGGVQSFRCRGARRDSTAGHLMLFNPDEPHDGWSGSRGGFAYRMLYITADGMAQLVDDVAGVGGRGMRLSRAAFTEPLVSDRKLSAQFAAASDELLIPANSLQAAERLSDVLRLLFERYAGGRAGTDLRPAASPRISRVRDLLESRYSEDLTISMVSDVAGMSRVHATRQFTLAFGIPPHAYLNQLRIRHAKRLLLAGSSAVHVAADVGFVDQSHFTRRFKRSVGVSPLAWAKSMGVRG